MSYLLLIYKSTTCLLLGIAFVRLRHQLKITLALTKVTYVKTISFHLGDILNPLHNGRRCLWLTLILYQKEIEETIEYCFYYSIMI